MQLSPKYTVLGWLTVVAGLIFAALNSQYGWILITEIGLYALIAMGFPAIYCGKKIFSSGKRLHGGLLILSGVVVSALLFFSPILFRLLSAFGK